MSEFVNTIDILGEEEYYKQLVERTIAEVNDDRISSVGPRAFYKAVNLSKVDLPNIKRIRDYAFCRCGLLTDIVIPTGVTDIDHAAFQYCSSLSNIVIPDSVTSIGNSAFTTCESLTNIIIGSGVTSIDSLAFDYFYVNEIKDISVIIKPPAPPIIESVGCFRNKKNNADNFTFYVPLESIDAYKTATNWSSYAYRMRPYVESPSELDGIISYDKANVAGIVYNFDGNGWYPTPSQGLVYTLNGDNASYSVSGIGTCTDTNLSIPPVYEGLPVNEIGYMAFGDNSAITSVVIPDSVTKIGTQAFIRCSALQNVYFGSGVTSIGNTSFNYCKAVMKYDFSRHTTVPSLNGVGSITVPANCKIVVPDSLYDTWIAATNWSTYASYIIKASEYTEV